MIIFQILKKNQITYILRGITNLDWRKTPEIDNFQQVEDFWNLGDNLSAYLLQWIQVVNLSIQNI